MHPRPFAFCHLTLPALVALLLVATLGGSLTSRPAEANVFGAAPSAAAARRVKACNDVVEKGFRARHLLRATTPDVSDLEAAVERLRAGPLSVQEAGNATALVTALRDLDGRLAREYGKHRCETVYVPVRQDKRRPGNRLKGPLTYSLAVQVASTAAGDEPEDTIPDIQGGIDPEFRFLFGGSAAASTPASEPDVESTGFSPALGVAYASNSNATVLLIDPSVASADTLSLSGTQAGRDLGREILAPNLTRRSAYGQYAYYFLRYPNSVLGVMGRLVARRSTLDIALAPVDGKEVTGTESVDAFFLAPTVALSWVMGGKEVAGKAFSAGAQVGLTGRWLVAEEDLPGKGIALVRDGDTTKAWDGSTIWGLGLDATLFLGFNEVMPFLRMTWLMTSDNAPQSLEGLSLVFGLDVMAALDFKSDQDEPPSVEPDPAPAGEPAPADAPPVAPPAAATPTGRT